MCNVCYVIVLSLTSRTHSQRSMAALRQILSPLQNTHESTVIHDEALAKVFIDAVISLYLEGECEHCPPQWPNTHKKNILLVGRWYIYSKSTVCH